MSDPQPIGNVTPISTTAAAEQLRDYHPQPIAAPRTQGRPPRVPTRYHHRLDHLEQTAPVHTARTWLQRVRDDRDDRRGLLILGQVGRGKSAIAGALAVETQAPVYSQFWPALDLLAEARREIDQPADRTPVRQRIATRRLLILDDIGAEKPTDWTVGVLTDVIAATYDDCRLMVATSNLTPSQLADHLGERTVSRLREMTDLLVVEGPDRRRTVEAADG